MERWVRKGRCGSVVALIGDGVFGFRAWGLLGLGVCGLGTTASDSSSANGGARLEAGSVLG